MERLRAPRASYYDDGVQVYPSLRLMHAYNIVRARVRQREGASGISTCMRKGAFHARRSSFSRYWLSIRSRTSRLCRSARTGVSCALQEGPRDHYVLRRCFKTVTRKKKRILRQRRNRCRYARKRISQLVFRNDNNILRSLSINKAKDF